MLAFGIALETRCTKSIGSRATCFLSARRYPRGNTNASSRQQACHNEVTSFFRGGTGGGGRGGKGGGECHSQRRDKADNNDYLPVGRSHNLSTMYLVSQGTKSICRSKPGRACLLSARRYPLGTYLGLRHMKPYNQACLPCGDTNAS